MRGPLLLAASAAATGVRPRVGIIGSGFTGSSTAYYLNQLCAGCYDMTIFEGVGRQGGRVGHTKVPGTDLVVNIGGDDYAQINQYVIGMTEELGIPPADFGGLISTNTSALWLGPGKGWRALPTKLGRNPRLPLDALAGLVEIELFDAAVSANYRERGNLTHGAPFESVNEYLSKGGLARYAAQSMRGLMEKAGISAALRDDLIEPMTRDIYDQALGLNALAGMATVTDGASKVYQAQGGNDVITRALANASGAAVRLSSPVAAVELESDGLFTLTVNGTALTGWDWVVLAAPIEQRGADGSLQPIQWRGFQLPDVPPRPYQHWYVTWVLADSVDAGALERDGEVPDLVLTPEGSTAQFVKLGAEYDVAGGRLWKIFSNEPVAPQLAAWFRGLRWNQTTHWPATFPDLSPTKQYQPLRLHPRVLYPCALESIAVAMEVAATAGRNAAQQLHAAAARGR